MRKGFLAWMLGAGLVLGTTASLAAGQGPFAAQIQVAIRTLLASAQTVSGAWTFSGGIITSGSGLAVANVGANSCGTSAATIAGNTTTFEITVGATSGTQCRVTFPTAAPNRWNCTVTDSTTTIATRATVVDTTHTDFLGAFVAGDTVTGVCIAR